MDAIRIHSLLLISMLRIWYDCHNLFPNMKPSLVYAQVNTKDIINMKRI